MDTLFLEQLSNAAGTSGDEAPVRDLIVGAIRENVDEYRVDNLGNLIALKRAGRGARRKPLQIVVTAHMDEVGLLIVHADNDGRLRFRKVGGILDRVLPSQAFLIGKGGVPGVIGWKPVHKTTAAEQEKVIEADELSIDIGAKSREDALGAVMVGDFAVFATRFSAFGEGLVRGKAFDDRAGCAALVELLAGDYPFDLFGVFTVQEEVGSRGARVAAYGLQADAAFALEATPCDDWPKERDLSPTTRLGHGPAITIADRETISDKRLVKLMTTTARDEEIPHQVKQPLIGGTDAARFHLAGTGIPSISVSVPTRYIHSPAALLSIEDFDNLIRLMRAALSRLQRGLPEA